MSEEIVLDLTPLDPGEPIQPEHIEPYADEVEPDDVVILHGMG